MSLYVTDFLDGRIEEIVRTLRKTDSEYALAVEKRKALYDDIDPILHHERDITISAGDCLNLLEFIELEFTITAHLQQALYRQGYLDCVKLLTMLGLLASAPL